MLKKCGSCIRGHSKKAAFPDEKSGSVLLTGTRQFKAPCPIFIFAGAGAIHTLSTVQEYFGKEF
jgi:hypothetical protein